MEYNDDIYLDILHRTWGYSDFRGIQRDIIRSIVEGNDTLGLMPTGGGKSLTFQVPALAMEGVCIVVTPLIALMKDQVEHLRQKGVVAAAVCSGMTRREIMVVLDNCILGNTKLLYVSPERISTELFRLKLSRMKVSFITVDEAHCISQWGYDFRPSYLNIADIRQIKPDVPILALTATATPNVVDDIQDRLGFKQHNVFKMSFERKNLAYIVRQTENKDDELTHILNSVRGSAIVYVRTRKKAKDVSEFLQNNNISATFYHAGLSSTEKDLRQSEWQNNATRVIVATNAFGMGIDKPDVRLVIHTDCPNSLEAYFQEAGRAGRDGQKAYAVLLFNDSDEMRIERRINAEFPDKTTICSIYEHMAYFFQLAAGAGAGHTFMFDIDRFCQTFHYMPFTVDAALRIIARSGYIEYEMEPDSRTRLMFTLERDQLYMLESNSPNEELVITTLLRMYSGLFVDYRYIDMSALSQATGLTHDQVFLILKSLNQRHILHFIPQRTMPLVSYVRNRVLPDELHIPAEAYEHRKEQALRMAKAIVGYARNNVVCRSRQLLCYFGEEKSTDCAQCDVCLDANSSKTAANKQIDVAQKAIMNILADGKKHNVTEVLQIMMNRDVIGDALEYLVHEELINVDGSYIFL